MLLGETPLHDGSDSMKDIFCGQIICWCNLCLPGGFFMPLCLHDLKTSLS